MLSPSAAIRESDGAAVTDGCVVSDRHAASVGGERQGHRSARAHDMQTRPPSISTS